MVKKFDDLDISLCLIMPTLPRVEGSNPGGNKYSVGENCVTDAILVSVNHIA